MSGGSGFIPYDGPGLHPRRTPMKDSPAIGILKAEAIKTEMAAQTHEATARQENEIARSLRKDAESLRTSIKHLQDAEAIA